MLTGRVIPGEPGSFAERATAAGFPPAHMAMREADARFLAERMWDDCGLAVAFYTPWWWGCIVEGDGGRFRHEVDYAGLVDPDGMIQWMVGAWRVAREQLYR